ALGTNVFEASAKSGDDGRHGTKKSDQASGSDGARAHWANVGAPDLVGGHGRNGNCGRIDRLVLGELSIEIDGRHDDEPGDDASREKNAGDARTDDVADAEIFGGDVGGEAGPLEPFGSAF